MNSSIIVVVTMVTNVQKCDNPGEQSCAKHRIKICSVDQKL